MTSKAKMRLERVKSHLTFNGTETKTFSAPSRATLVGEWRGEYALSRVPGAAREFNKAVSMDAHKSLPKLKLKSSTPLSENPQSGEPSPSMGTSETNTTLLKTLEAVSDGSGSGAVNPEVILYQIPWSHYCESVRWALDFKQVPFVAYEIAPLSMASLRQFKGIPKITPILVHIATGEVVQDSVAILNWLDMKWPNRGNGPLFPADDEGRKEVNALVCRFNEQLGHAGRRIAYSRIIMEAPDLLGFYFVFRQMDPKKNPWLKAWWGYPIRWYASHAMCLILIQRFGMHKNYEQGAFANLDAGLEELCQRFSENGDATRLVGGKTTAADIMLAAMLRPLTVIPRYARNPKYAGVWSWLKAIQNKYGRTGAGAYDVVLSELRSKDPNFERYWSQRKWDDVTEKSLARPEDGSEAVKDALYNGNHHSGLVAARNDHRDVNASFWRLLTEYPMALWRMRARQMYN